MTQLLIAFFLVLFAFTSATPVFAQTRYLPKAGFQTFSGQPSQADNELPVVNGLHLTPGMDRKRGSGFEAYNPGEPKLNMALVRWDKRKFPLRIWISPGLKLPEVPFELLAETRVDTVYNLLRDPQQMEALQQCPRWTPEMNNMVAAGFEQWRELENEGVIAFGYVDDPRQANVLVFFTNFFQGAAGPGGSNVHGLTIGQVFSTDDVMKKQRLGEPPMPVVMELVVNEDMSKLQAEAAHEFGHALGIKAHSPYREDIMYEHRIVNTLSPADKATLRALYKQMPKYWYY